MYFVIMYRHQFVNLYVDMLLNKSVERSFSPFKHGLLNVCGGRVLQLFRSQELMAVVIGNVNFDIFFLKNLSFILLRFYKISKNRGI